MPKLTLLTALEIAKALQKMGFECKRQKGSHMFFEHPDGRTTLVPNHPGETLDRGLLNKIIKQDLQTTREEFLKHVK
ncbi:MAG: type II toxin-antitoxin system HicA family toxin [Candidatus Diapherotrites archaeon]|nr:type II toxin-antitoxin system HicA family toxin [Candidatus Diapherotrites archaeon]